jgi:hypothetical protein
VDHRVSNLNGNNDATYEGDSTDDDDVLMPALKAEAGLGDAMRAKGDKNYSWDLCMVFDIGDPEEKIDVDHEVEVMDKKSRQSVMKTKVKKVNQLVYNRNIIRSIVGKMRRAGLNTLQYK